MTRTHNRLFISCVSREFGEVRRELRKYLARADCDVKVQEDFCQTPHTMLQKLDEYIRHSTAVIHLLGELQGSVAGPEGVKEYLKHMDGRFLERFPKLRCSLGGFEDISYTQWEAFIALHHRVPLFVYQYSAQKTVGETTNSDSRRHSDYLRLASRYPESFEGLADLLGKLIGDLPRVFASDFGSVIVTSRDEAARHQESYAARNDLEKALHLHGLRFVLIPKATILVDGVKIRFPPADDPEASPHLYMSESVLSVGDHQRLAKDVHLGKFRDVADWLEIVRNTERMPRLPTFDELRHAMHLGLISRLEPPYQELCCDQAKLHAIFSGSFDATLRYFSSPVHNLNMKLPETLSWRLVLGLG